MLLLIAYIILGLIAGIISGIVGIGGGIIIVPALVFIFGMSQLQAQGTTLALLIPPIGILAALTYYKQGYVDLKIAILVCVGFIIGGLIGAKYAINLPTRILVKIFGIFLLFMGLKMIISK